jgi:hypothetical protein
MMDNDKPCAFAKVGKSSKGKLQVMKSKLATIHFSTLYYFLLHTKCPHRFTKTRV